MLYKNIYLLLAVRILLLLIILLGFAYMAISYYETTNEALRIRGEAIGQQKYNTYENKSLKNLYSWWYQGNVDKDDDLSSYFQGLADVSLLEEKNNVQPVSAPSFCSYTKLVYKVAFTSLVPLLDEIIRMPSEMYVNAISIQNNINNLDVDLVIGKCDVA